MDTPKQKIIGNIRDRYDHVSVIRGIIALSLALLTFATTLFFAPQSDSTFAEINMKRLENGLLVEGTLNTVCNKKKTTLSHSQDIRKDCILAVQKGSNAHMVIDNHAELRLSSETSVVFLEKIPQLTVLEARSPQGKIWIANSLSRQPISFIINGVHIQNIHASTGIEWTPQSVIISSFDGMTHVNLYDGTFTYASSKNSYLTSLRIPPQYQLDVVFSRINSDTRKLYYSKLIKEFPLTSLTDERIQKLSFISENVDHDRLQRLARRNVLKNTLQSIQQSTPIDASNDLIHSLMNSITLSDTQMNSRFLSRFDFLVSEIGQSVLLKNDAIATSLSSELSSEIQVMLSENLDPSFKKRLLKRVVFWDELLLSAVEDDDLELFAEHFHMVVQQSQLNTQTELIAKAESQLSLVFRNADDNRRKSKKQLDYLNNFVQKELLILPASFYEKNLTAVKSLRNMLWIVLHRYSYFYDTDSFSGLLALNAKITDIVHSGEQKTEEMQTIIQNYLRTLAKMSHSIKRGDSSIDTERVFALAEQLLTKIDEFQLENMTDSAVVSYFTDQKAHFRNEFAFLQSDSFKKLARQDFDEVRYEQLLADFIRIQDEQEKIKELIGEKKVSLNDDQFNLSADEANTIAGRILSAHGMSYSSLQPDPDNPRMVTVVDGSRDLVSFKGVLDVRTEFIFNLEIEGNKISSGITIADLPALLVSAQKIIESEKNETIEASTQSSDAPLEQKETVLDEILKELTIKRLQSLQFDVQSESLEVIDGFKELVKVNTATWGEDKIPVSFHYNLKKGLFIDLSIKKNAYTGVYTFEEFKQLMFEQEG